MEQANPSRSAKVLAIALGVVVTLVGVFMLVGGSYLISLGGSWYAHR